MAEGAREDLYYRLNVFPIQVPPLRDRAEDIPLLVQRLVDEFSRTFGKRIEMIERDTMAALQRYSWPGNIRELRNVVERAMIVTTSRRLVIPLPESTSSAVARSPKLVDVEREHILAVLESSSWRIRVPEGQPRDSDEAHDARDADGEAGTQTADGQLGHCQDCQDCQDSGLVGGSRDACPGNVGNVGNEGALRNSVGEPPIWAPRTRLIPGGHRIGRAAWDL